MKNGGELRKSPPPFFSRFFTPHPSPFTPASKASTNSIGRFPGLLVSEHLKVAKNSALWNGVREGFYEGRKRKGIRSPFVSAIFHPLIAVMGSLSVTIPKTNLCLKAFHHHHHRRQHHHHNQHNHRLNIILTIKMGASIILIIIALIIILITFVISHHPSRFSH